MFSNIIYNFKNINLYDGLSFIEENPFTSMVASPINQTLLPKNIQSYHQISFFKNFNPKLAFTCLIICALSFIILYLFRKNKKKQIEGEPDETNPSIPKPVQGAPFFPLPPINRQRTPSPQPSPKRVSSHAAAASPSPSPRDESQPGTPKSMVESQDLDYVNVDADGQVEGLRSPTPPGSE